MVERRACWDETRGGGQEARVPVCMNHGQDVDKKQIGQHKDDSSCTVP